MSTRQKDAGGESYQPNVHDERTSNYPRGGFARDFATADGKRVRLEAFTSQQFADLVKTTGLAGTFAFLERALDVDFCAGCRVRRNLGAVGASVRPHRLGLARRHGIRRMTEVLARVTGHGRAYGEARPAPHRQMAPGPGDLGRRVARQREELGLTTQRVADRAGISVPYLEYLEHYPALPTEAALKRLADALRTTPSALLGAGADWPSGRSGSAHHSAPQ